MVAGVLAGTAICFAVWGDAVSELPVTTVKGVKCYYYEVQPKESIYQVTNRLGVTREQITAYNPSAADGLKPKMRLYFPVADFTSEAGNRKAVYAAAAGVKTHVVKKGESLYGIARQYGMSPDYLLKLNPQAEDGLRQGDELRIVADEDLAAAGLAEAAPSQDKTAVPDADGYLRYEIRPGDTLFSIANANNVPLELILDANSTLDPINYKAGELIRIPVSQQARARHSASSSAAMAETSAASTVSNASASAVSAPAGVDMAVMRGDTGSSTSAGTSTFAEVATEDDADADSDTELQVGVLLPFMLADENQSRTTQLYTEFFKGMLMAADTLRNTPGPKVKFTFFDTSASLDSVQSIIARGGINDMDLIVGPDNQAQLSAIVEGADPETVVLNIFAVKDESYRNHRNMIQTNIPHDAMYAGAIDAFMEKYAGVVPVFINRNAGQADKDSFVKALKERLSSAGRDFREITFTGSLSDEDLAAIDPDFTPVVFVPNSGSKTEFARFVKAITSLREKAVDSSKVTIFGYPEWVTFRGDSFDELCALDATIYSRFLSTDNSSEINRLKEQYKSLYGTEMFEAVPTQGILGYDTARFIIEGLRAMHRTGAFPAQYNGVQSTLRLGWSGATSIDSTTGEMSSDGGLVNEALYIINYRPGGVIEWEL